MNVQTKHRAHGQTWDQPRPQATCQGRPRVYRLPIAAAAAFVVAFCLQARAQSPNASVNQPAPAADLWREIDPFLGTMQGGDVEPGPAVPFGMVKPGPDVGPNTENGGWLPEGEINGFSQTHVSGTGGGASSGNILIQATTGRAEPRRNGSLRAAEAAHAGFYAVDLVRFGVHAEVTTAARAAIYRFTYRDTGPANLVVDVSHCLSSGPEYGEAQRTVASEVHLVSPTEITGSSSIAGGWNKQPVPYTVFFVLQTDTPATATSTFRGNDVYGSHHDEVATDSTVLGGIFSFGVHAGQQVRVKIGLSYVSVEQARENLNRQISGFDFDRTQHEAEQLWNRAVSTVEIAGATPAERHLAYTALYHTMLMPVDRSGENPLWTSDEPYFDDFYTVWDTFRTSTPLLTLIAEDDASRIARAMVDIYRHDGWLPDGRQGNFNGRIQGGSNGDMVMADGFVKHLPGVNWQDAYAAVVKDAEVSPSDEMKEGRGGLDDWKHLGYLTVEGVDRPASKHMEYAANDFAAATLAAGLGKPEDAAKYRARAGNWAKLWDATMREDGFTGWIRPRHRDGAWLAPFTARDQGTFYGNTFYEGDSWTYSLFVPQDVRALVEKLGGPAQFSRRLDAFFGSGDPGTGHFDVTNEPGFLTPYLYLWSSTPSRTAEVAHRIVTRNYRDARDGLPGNDDSGAMSSLYLFHAFGFFPNAGQDVYLLGTPLWPRVVLHLAEGKSLTITARNLSPQNVYVASVRLNGKPLDHAWFRHASIAAGGTLEFEMAPSPGTWPTGPPPPSMSDPAR